MAYILDKETFTKKNIKIIRSKGKSSSHEDIINYIEETSIIENFREYFIYERDVIIIVSDNYVLYSSNYVRDELTYMNISSRIISLVNKNINKTLLIQTEKYIKILQYHQNIFLKHKFLINFSEIGEINDLYKIIHSDYPFQWILIVRTSLGLFYIENNKLKKKSQAVSIPEAIKYIEYINKCDDEFLISYFTENKIIKAIYNRYIYDDNIGSKTFNIYINKKKEYEIEPHIYKSIEKKIIENCQKLSSYENFISSEIVPLNKSGDLILILENEENKAIIFWKNEYRYANETIIEIPRETKLNIYQNNRTVLIYYFSDTETKIIMCAREQNIYERQKKIIIETRNLNRKDITGVLCFRGGSKVIFSTTQSNILAFSDNDKNGMIQITKKEKESINEIYYCYETSKYEISVLFQPKGFQKNVYRIIDKGNPRDMTLDFEMSEKNIKSLNELSRYSVIEIGQIILSDDMEDFEF